MMPDDEAFVQETVPAAEGETRPAVRSLRELIERVSGRGFQAPAAGEDSGLADPLPFPFLAIVGQQEMKL
ncbi:MAG TPA: hypothetical protein VF498_04915, partial [Anaerolineales bacterium]